MFNYQKTYTDLKYFFYDEILYKIIFYEMCNLRMQPNTTNFHFKISRFLFNYFL